MRFIVLTAKQADMVRSEKLDPRDMGDGRYILNPELVLREGENPEHREFLASLPQEDIELPQEVEGV